MKDWFVCPDGQKQPIPECFARCRMGERCAPLTYLRRAGERSEWKGRPGCTALLRGARQVWLEYTTPWGVSPDASAWMLLGSAGHVQMENAGKEAGDVVEGWVELDGIVGRFDFIEPNGDGERTFTLIDYKVVGSYAVAKALGMSTKRVPLIGPDGQPSMWRGKPRFGTDVVVDPSKADMGDYPWQENFYRVACNLKNERTGLPDRVTRMRLFMIARDGGTMIATNRGVTRNVYYFEVQKIDDDEVRRKFVWNKQFLLGAFERNPKGEAGKPWPPPCTAAEAWDGNRCRKYCNVSGACVARGDNPWLRPDQRVEEIEEGGTDG